MTGAGTRVAHCTVESFQLISPLCLPIFPLHFLVQENRQGKGGRGGGVVIVKRQGGTLHLSCSQNSNNKDRKTLPSMLWNHGTLVSFDFPILMRERTGGVIVKRQGGIPLHLHRQNNNRKCSPKLPITSGINPVDPPPLSAPSLLHFFTRRKRPLHCEEEGWHAPFDAWLKLQLHI